MEKFRQLNSKFSIRRILSSEINNTASQCCKKLFADNMQFPEIMTSVSYFIKKLNFARFFLPFHFWVTFQKNSKFLMFKETAKTMKNTTTRVICYKRYYSSCTKFIPTIGVLGRVKIFSLFKKNCFARNRSQKDFLDRRGTKTC